MGTRRAYSYIRFSSPEQAKGDSYRRQHMAAQAFCEENGLEFVDSSEYLFFDQGRSAFKGDHLDASSALTRFLGYVENGSIEKGSYLIVESLDRLSRESLKAALPGFLSLLSKGIIIHTSIDGKTYTEDYVVTDLIFSILEMGRAHNESKTKSVRVGQAWRKKQIDARENKKPLGRACPYWLVLDGGEYKPIADRVGVIKRIFEMSAAGYGARLIAKKLNADEVPVFGSTARNSSGDWGSSSVRRLLCNRALLGEYQPTGLVDSVRKKLGDPVKDYFPVVLTEDEFLSAQSALHSRRQSKSTKQSSNFNVWQGVAICGICGSAMHLVNKGAPPKGNKYLRCYGASKGTCANRQVRLDVSEVVFKEVLAKVDSLSLIQESQGKLRKQKEVLSAKERDIEVRISEIKKSLLDVGSILSPSIMEVLASLESSLNDLRIEKAAVIDSLQRDKIVNKADFLERLDLESFEARSRANLLLKSLEVTVGIDARNPSAKYVVYSKGELLLGLLSVGREVMFLANGKKGVDLISQHNEKDFLSYMSIKVHNEGKLELTFEDIETINSGGWPTTLRSNV